MGPGMKAPESAPEIGDGDLGVDLGAVDGAVAEEFLDVADGGAAFEEMGGAGVAESMEGYGSSA